MKQAKFTILIFSVLFSIISASFAQDATTQGTEFWVSFMTNGHKYHPLAPNDGNWILTQLLISSKRDCSGTINNPQTGWTTSFSVTANSITTIDIPEDQAYVDGTSEAVVNKGLQVISDDTVSVYCTNIAYLSFDASYVLPIQGLADEYIIQTYDQSRNSGNNYVTNNQTSAFLIVATQDNTVVDITPSVATLGGHAAGSSFTTVLNKGQVYQVRSTKEGDNRDLSGSRVMARNEKPIAVFNGNTLTSIPNNGSTLDHIFEQAMPLQSWGKRFVVTSSLDRVKDVVKVTSAIDNNEIRKDGMVISTLNENESCYFELRNSDKSCFIECTGSAAVFLYNTTQDGTMIGDPSVVWIAPIEQRIDDITFTTFNNQYININDHYVNIIVDSDDTGSVFLDGNLIPASQFEPVNGTENYSFARMSIPHRVHRLECANGLNAHVYGFGAAKGYAYLVGSKAIDLSTKVFMNETFVQKGGTYEYCPEASITFEAEVNASNAEILWDFGDGTTSTQNPVVHTYSEKRVYEVVLTATAKGSRSNDVSHYFVDTRKKTVTAYEELCQGDVYSGYGFNVVINNDTVLGTEIDNPIHPVCKDSLLIYVTTLENFYADIHDTICWQNESISYTEHGFDILIDHPGTYTDHFAAAIPNGCDSIIDLTLIVTDRIISPNSIEYSGCSESFTWNDYTYTESGDYEQVFTSVMGCDSIIQLHIFLEAAVEGDTTTVTGICNAYEWLGHLYDETGFYTDTLTNTLGCDSIVHLDLSIMLDSDMSEIRPIDTLANNSHWVITTTEFDIHSYEFMIWDKNSGIEWDSVQWAFETDNNNWDIEPLGSPATQCRVFVLNPVEDTVWLEAKLFNECYPEGKTIRYWLISSFFGINETTTNTQFSILPNPNKGQMQLYLQNLIGKLDIKVIDMKGILVDHLQIINDSKELSIPYDCNCKANGLYLFVLNIDGHSYTEKVLITDD